MNGKLHKILFAFIAAFLLVAVVMDIVIKDKKATAIIPDYTIESESETETETEREPETETETEREPETETETERESETETQTTASDKKAYYEVVFECINSWENNGKYNFQYNGKITNESDYTMESWNAVYTIPEGCVISSSWNGTCVIEKDKLYISPCDWNSKVAPQSTAEACGFIIEAPKDIGKLVYNGICSDNIQLPVEPVTKPSDEVPTEPVTEESYIPPVVESGTPFENHGALTVKGVNLTDSKGNPYQLKGVSTFGLQWMPQYVDYDTFKFLRDSWGVNTMRLAMYTGEGGYCSSGQKAAELVAVIDKGVKACTELGMYVIIDWHILSDGNPNTYKEQAKEFFAKMSSRYSEYENVIYEICNEPNGVSWEEVKRYANEVIPVIRANDSDAIIIVGTPTWSQDVDLVANNPLNEENQSNVMYAAHFYAATHGDYIRNKVIKAISDGTPVFISEFSICDASGNGALDYDSAAKWKSLIREYNLSYAGWNLGNKNESSALIKAGVDKLYGWSDSEISDTGKWLRDLILGK